MPSRKGKPQPAGIGMVPVTTELGAFIRARRLERGLRQVPLSEAIGLQGNQISAFEVGKNKYLDDDLVERLAEVLQCDPEELRKRRSIKHAAEPTTDLGKLIRSRREELGLSTEAFADRLKTTPLRATSMELRIAPRLRYGTLQRLAVALELNIAELTPFAVLTRKEAKGDLGKLVRARRQELGMSILQVAEKLNVTRQLVNHIELGKCKLSESDEMLIKLAQVLKLDVAQLEAARPARQLKQVKPGTPLGEFLVAKRLELGLTGTEVAEKAGISVSTLSRIETRDKAPRRKTVEKIANALGCELPPELTPPYHVRVERGIRTDPNLLKIKELSGIQENAEIVRKALALYRDVLEKRARETSHP